MTRPKAGFPTKGKEEKSEPMGQPIGFFQNHKTMRKEKIDNEVENEYWDDEIEREKYKREDFIIKTAPKKTKSQKAAARKNRLKALNETAQDGKIKMIQSHPLEIRNLKTIKEQEIGSCSDFPCLAVHGGNNSSKDTKIAEKKASVNASVKEGAKKESVQQILANSQFFHDPEFVDENKCYNNKGPCFNEYHQGFCPCKYFPKDWRRREIVLNDKLQKEALDHSHVKPHVAEKKHPEEVKNKAEVNTKVRVGAASVKAQLTVLEKAKEPKKSPVPQKSNDWVKVTYKNKTPKYHGKVSSRAAEPNKAVQKAFKKAPKKVEITKTYNSDFPCIGDKKPEKKNNKMPHWVKPKQKKNNQEKKPIIESKETVEVEVCQDELINDQIYDDFLSLIISAVDDAVRVVETKKDQTDFEILLSMAENAGLRKEKGLYEYPKPSPPIIDEETILYNNILKMKVQLKLSNFKTLRGWGHFGLRGGMPSTRSGEKSLDQKIHELEEQKKLSSNKNFIKYIEKQLSKLRDQKVKQEIKGRPVVKADLKNLDIPAGTIDVAPASSSVEGDSDLNSLGESIQKSLKLQIQNSVPAIIDIARGPRSAKRKPQNLKVDIPKLESTKVKQTVVECELCKQCYLEKDLHECQNCGLRVCQNECLNNENTTKTCKECDLKKVTTSQVDILRADIESVNAQIVGKEDIQEKSDFINGCNSCKQDKKLFWCMPCNGRFCESCSVGVAGNYVIRDDFKKIRYI